MKSSRVTNPTTLILDIEYRLEGVLLNVEKAELKYDSSLSLFLFFFN